MHYVAAYREVREFSIPHVLSGCLATGDAYMSSQNSGTEDGFYVILIPVGLVIGVALLAFFDERRARKRLEKWGSGTLEENDKKD